MTTHKTKSKSITDDRILFSMIPGNDICQFRVEYITGVVPFPEATAYVMTNDQGRPALLYFIIVADQFRRQGIASKLVRACQKRWPGLRMSDAISDSGEGLLRSMRSSDREPAEVVA